MSSVPFFLTGIVRGMFSDDITKWALMDWDDIFSKNYNFVKEECSILIFDLRRILLYQTSGKELEKSKLNEIFVTLKNLNDYRNINHFLVVTYKTHPNNGIKAN